MAEPPEFWLFVLSNILVLALGCLLTGLSIAAHRRSPKKRAFLGASVGFGTITLGTLVEAGYELGVRGSYHIQGRELLALHTVEGILIAIGLTALFYSLRQY